MAFNDNILDVGEIQENTFRPNIVEYTVEGITRLAHYIVDTIARIFIMFFLLNIADLLDQFNLFGFATFFAFLAVFFFFLYYPIMEYSYGKTLGKMITKSSVVDVNGSKITFLQAAGRTLCRLIPFDAFSFLGSDAIGWHDSISRTRVVKDTFFEHSK